jgi:uncharacterized protein YdiU (UPF0061 family)
LQRTRTPPSKRRKRQSTHAYAAGLSRKLGLFQSRPDDLSLAQDLLERMARNGADFTLVFRRLCDAAASPDGDAAVRNLFTDPTPSTIGR